MLTEGHSYDLVTGPVGAVGRAERRAITLPFINAHPITDVCAAIMLLPVWWVLGVEQFIWPLLFGWTALRLAISRHYRLVLVPPVRWLLAFIVAQIISGLFIVESYRLLTFIRNLGSYVAVALAIIVITNANADERQLKRVINSLLLIMVGVGAISLLALLGVWQPEFRSLVGAVMPKSIASTDYGGHIAYRNLGQPSWFAGIIYYRLSGMFLYATMYASALAMVIPIAYFAHGTAKSLVKKFALAVVIVLLLINMLGTTGRVATLSMIAGAGAYVILASRARRIARMGAFMIMTLAVSLMLVSPIELASGGDIVDQVLYARGGGSVEHRTAVYQATLSGWLGSPLFGWGTERDVADIPYPAGSHSFYLGVLYKHGLVGFLIFLGMWWSMWRHTAPIGVGMQRNIRLEWSLGYLRITRWVLCAALINSATDVLDLDATTILTLGLILGTAIAARRNCVEYATL